MVFLQLQDVSRLKTLKDLTLLVLLDNPIADLPHYRLYIIFHLRCLNVLDGQPITNQERQAAHERFNMGNILDFLMIILKQNVHTHFICY